MDGTVGAGGHAHGILERSSPEGQLLGLDRDVDALRVAADRLRPYAERVRLSHASFEFVQAEAERIGWQAGSVDGIVLDLGVSSMQLEDPSRGFGFRSEGPLDMRFDVSAPLQAADLVNGLPVDELADLLRRLGEEPQARRIARAIVAARPIGTPRQLADVVAQASGAPRGRRLHPATLTFQALRIAVNDELAALERTLPQAVGLLRPGGRLAVIAFQSLEDRLVKEFMRRESRDCLCPPEQPMCTCGHRAQVVPQPFGRKAVKATSAELARNPRARSARLRVVERLPDVV